MSKLRRERLIIDFTTKHASLIKVYAEIEHVLDSLCKAQIIEDYRIIEEKIRILSDWMELESPK